MNPDFWSTVSRRRSVRRYADRPVPFAEVRKIVAAAASAPSAHNAQPWHFTVITSPPLRNRLVRAMAAAFDRDMTADGIDPDARRARAERSLELLGKAPVLIVVHLIHCRTETSEHTMAVQGTAAATGYLLLAAAAAGLGSCWYSAPLFCPQVVRQCLGTDADWKPQALVTLGYPEQSPPDKPKKTLQEIMTHEQ